MAAVHFILLLSGGQPPDPPGTLLDRRRKTKMIQLIEEIGIPAGEPAPLLARAMRVGLGEYKCA